MTEDIKDTLNEDKGDLDDLDKILGAEFLDEAAKKNPDKVEEAKAHEAMSPRAEQVVAEGKSLARIEQEREAQDIPSLRGEGYPSDYIAMAERVKWQYEMLPKLDYDAIYQELAELSIKSCPTPTLQVLNDEIQKVQGAKDRVAEIFIEVVKCYNFKKRAVDILQDAWGKFTTEKNADARKGDAAFRLSNFMLDYASTEALLKASTHVLKNLDSLHDSLSRRITIYQLTMKLQDIGRSALPEYDFDKPSNSPHEDVSDLFDVDENEREDNEDSGASKPQLRSF